MKKYNISIDLGGTKILTALVEKKTNKILFIVKKKIKKEKGNDKVTQKIFETIDELILNSEVNISEIEAVGIATAGQIDKNAGVLINSCNLECNNLNLKELIENKYKIKTNVLNDVEAATIAELLIGSAKGYKNVFCVFVGTGIGSCIVINNKIYNGANGFAGEFGHMVIDINGRSCACGANGCLEAYASRTAIEKRIYGYIKNGNKSIITDLTNEYNISTKHIKKALDAHDEIVTLSVNEAIDYLSSGLANVINFLNPEIVVLGGGLIQGIDEIYLETIRRTKLKVLPNAARTLEFKKSALEDYSAILGTTLLNEYINNEY